MGTISMILGIAAIIFGVLGMIGTGLTSILSMIAVGTYVIPVLFVLGIILGCIATVKNSDSKQKNRGRTGVLCSVLGIILYVLMLICIIKIVGNWEI